MEKESKSVVAQLAARPGQFAKKAEKRPFLYRAQATKEVKKSLTHLVSATLDLQQEECLLLAGVALTTLDALVGKTTPKNRVARTQIQAKRPTEQLQDAKEMVHRLLQLLMEAAPKALSAQLLLDEEPTTNAHRQAAAKRAEEKERLHNETLGVIYPFSNTYPSEGVIRLYK
ncbi:MAG: hypothetical protein JSR80_04205 [Verrucomicrobia bacterium]|nr:hypothetical protein [Verrucomicrobiota bacterium]